jgi:hypothetical protein
MLAALSHPHICPVFDVGEAVLAGQHLSTLAGPHPRSLALRVSRTRPSRRPQALAPSPWPPAPEFNSS